MTRWLADKTGERVAYPQGLRLGLGWRNGLEGALGSNRIGRQQGLEI